MVSKDELIELLSEALEQMPGELRDARWLLKERDEFLAANVPAPAKTALQEYLREKHKA